MSTNKMFLLSLTIVLGACSSNVFVSQTGNMPSEERIADLRRGQTKNDVNDILGAPSNIVTLDNDTWLYMSSEIKQVAFFPPKEIDRKILSIKFNQNNQVSEISRYSKEHGEQIVIAEQATSHDGPKQGIIQEYFGGVGQYAPIAPTNEY